MPCRGGIALARVHFCDFEQGRVNEQEEKEKKGRGGGGVVYGDSYVECMVKGLPCIYVPSFRMVDTRLLGLEYL